MTVRILTGDVRERLRELADESVDCVVTSPPYWGLRDYGVEGQLGLERTLGEHVEVMTSVFRDVRRVLKPAGTLWLNYGDSYATSPNGRSAEAIKNLGTDDRTFRDKPFSTVGPIYGHLDANYEKTPRAGKTQNMGNLASQSGPRIAGVGVLKPKDLCGVPWRVAFALQEDGWWLRQDIIWSKPNPMPESVTDRCTKAHEYLFLLAKNAVYHYDASAICEASIHAGKSVLLGEKSLSRGQANGANVSASGNGLADSVTVTDTRNKRSVWEVATAPFADAHFATFPPALIEPCILAGCPKGGTVLDPFGGAGTTGLVADRLGRDAILIELNPAYADMARKRISGDCPMFTELSTSVREQPPEPRAEAG